jgi:glycosyltransferase involved in cell wall biosynthesis
MTKPNCFIVLTPGFPAHNGETSVLPFAQSFVHSFCKNYPELKLIVISFQYPYKAVTYTWHEAEVIALSGSNKGGLSRRITWLKALNTIRLLKKQYQVKGIFSFWLSECALVGQYANRLFGLKQYSWLIGQDAKPDNKVLKHLTLNEQTVVAMSINLVHQLQSHYTAPNIPIIPLGINPYYFDEIQPAPVYYDILGVGSLIKLKNYTLFIQLISELKTEFPFIKTAIIGDGPEQNALQAMIEQLELRNHVALIGALPHQAVVAYMKASNIFLHTSSYEGQATVFVESLYCGMKVICFDVGRLHSNENMFVCNDEAAMLETLRIQLQAQEQRKSILVQSMDDTVKQVMALYS